MVVGDRVREVRELPGELEMREQTRLERLVPEEHHWDHEEDPQPENPRREEQVGRDAPMSVEERSHLGDLLALDREPPLLVVGVREHRRVVLVHLREHVVGRKGERVGCRVGIELRGLVADALDGRDVACPERELRSDLRVVDEVHIRGSGRDASAQRDEHVVGKDDSALLRNRPLDLRIGEQEDVAGPRHARDEVPRRERLGVVVAVEPPDLTPVLCLLDDGQRAVERRVGDLRRIVAVFEHDQAKGVAHGVPDADPALELRILEELSDRGNGFRQLVVPRDAVHPREPGQRELPVRVERRVLLRRDEVLDVGDQALVELQRPVVVQVLAQGTVVVRRDDDVAVDAMPLRQPPLDLREVARIVVDVLVVVDLDPRLRRELLKRGRACQARVLARARRIDVIRPVREVEDVVRLAGARAATAAPAGG